MAKKRTSKAIGDSLERVVAKYYEALGFRVTPNVNIRGHQIDLLASKYLSGASQFTLMVEAKSRSSAPAGINEVTPFLNTARHLIASADVQGAAFVTDGAFSQDARQAVRDMAGVRLMTLEELEQDLFNYSESLLKLKYEYESLDIFREYISLEGVLGGSEKPIPDVAAHVLKWSRGGDKLLVVVGDFGSGKSTVLERVNYLQARARLADPNARFPILLRLRRLLQYSDLWAFIAASLRDTQMISPSRAALWSKLTAGQLLLLLDGFDEIHTGASAQDRASYLKTLAPLLTSGSPCVLSTRPMYFESFDEMARSLARQLNKPPALERVRATSFDVDHLLERLQLNTAEKLTRANLQTVVRLSHLTDEKISAYLKKFDDEFRRSTSVTGEEVKEFLYRIYDLEDLMKRPLLLHMVVATVIAGKVDLSNKELSIGPSTLYDVYTQLSVQRDRSKNALGQYLSESERLEICRRLAMKMLDKGSIELSASEVREAVVRAHLPTVARALASEREAALESAVTDIRVCTFLSRGDDGSLRFAHKSYFEFFVAQELVVGCKSDIDALGSFSARRLTKEVLYFLGSFARDVESFGRTILAALRELRRESEGVAALCQRIAFGSGSLLSDLRVQGGTISEVDLRRADATSACFEAVAFDNVLVRDLKATKWLIADCTMRRCTFESCDFSLSDLAMDADHVDFENVALHDSVFSIAGGEWSLRNCRIEGGETRLGGRGLLKEVRFESEGRVLAQPNLMLSAATVATFSGGVLVTNDRSPWYEEGAQIQLSRCVLAGVRLENRDVVALAKRVRVGAAKVVLRDCRGVVLTTRMQKDYVPNLRRYFPGVVFCDVDALDEALQSPSRARTPGGMGGTPASHPERRELLVGDALLASVAETIATNRLESIVTGVLARIVASPRASC